MKKIMRLSAVLPVALFIAGCSSDKEQPVAPLEGDFDVVMTVVPSEAETRASTQVGSDAENRINNNRLFFGTFEAGGVLKHPLYEAGDKNANVKAHFFIPSWGPSVAAKLPKEDYKNGFYTAAFSIPEKMNGTKKLNNLNDAAFTTLSWPDKTIIWTPGGEDEDNNIPMAAVNHITAQYMEEYYNSLVYDDNNPLRLPELKLTRAMAKVIVEDVDGIIQNITLTSKDKGSILPNIDDLLNGAAIVRPVTAAGATDMKQTISATGVAGAVYVFYAFEQSFYNADGTLAVADDPARKLISLEPKDSRLGTATIAIAPYAGGYVNTEAALSTLDGGAWQGLKRNTIYHFRVKKPAVGGIEIEVKPGEWQTHKEFFEF
ncbi:MAG: hypothetical protein K2M59_00210 [Muribaculaceae bacterium]|nr:hypothetical protein [Muribaculaceae bacterium]